MFLPNLNAEIVACILLFRKSRYKLILESTAKYGFPPIWGEKQRRSEHGHASYPGLSFRPPGFCPWGREERRIGPLQDPVTWYGINYTGTQITQWDVQNKGTLTSPARLSFVLKVPLRYLRPSVIYSVPSDRILQRAYSGTGPRLEASQCLRLSLFIKQ